LDSAIRFTSDFRFTNSRLKIRYHPQSAIGKSVIALSLNAQQSSVPAVNPHLDPITPNAVCAGEPVVNIHLSALALFSRPGTHLCALAPTAARFHRPPHRATERDSFLQLLGDLFASRCAFNSGLWIS
jgi:hypothetical protein